MASSVFSQLFANMFHIMAIQVVEFSSGVYKIRKIFAYESSYPKEIFEF